MIGATPTDGDSERRTTRTDTSATAAGDPSTAVRAGDATTARPACPACARRGAELQLEPGAIGALWRCPACRGAAVTMTVATKVLGEARLRALTVSSFVGDADRARSDARSDARTDAGSVRDAAPTRCCPWCAQPMSPGVDDPDGHGGGNAVEVCRPCQLLWFDADELPGGRSAAGSSGGAGPVAGAVRCSTCGAAARPDLDADCMYCGHRLAPARPPAAQLPATERRVPTLAQRYVEGMTEHDRPGRRRGLLTMLADQLLHGD